MLHEFVPPPYDEGDAPGEDGGTAAGETGAPDEKTPSFRLEATMERRERFVPDLDTEKEGILHYHAIFQPSVAPFRRDGALDAVLQDGSLSVADPSRHVLMLTRPAEAPPLMFEGRLTLTAEPGRLIPLPSVAAPIVLVAIESRPPAGILVTTDGADNLGISALHIPGPVTMELTYTLAAGPEYFAPPDLRIPDLNVSPSPAALLPPGLLDEARSWWPKIGVSPDQPLSRLLEVLVAHFRSFQAGRITDRKPGDSVYSLLMTSRKGVCRHRAYAFMITAMSLGLDTRFVYNEAHAFAELRLPGPGWIRVDLGGASSGLVVHHNRETTQYRPDGDPFPEPDGYRGSYSSPEPDPGPGDRHLPPMVRRGAIPTRTLLSGEVQALRSSPLLVKGRVEDLQGAGIPGIDVAITLYSVKGEKVSELGRTVTRSGGDFRIRVVVPPFVPLGHYDLRAACLGSDSHAPSLSE